jgi:hypothetical protein
LAGPKGSHAGAQFHDLGGDLMPEDSGWLNLGESAVQDVNVGAANADRLDLDKDLPWAGRRRPDCGVIQGKLVIATPQ